MPFCLQIVFLCSIIVLPLNRIRNRIEFRLFKSQYEEAYKLARKDTRKSSQYSYHLPNKYQSLSVGGGDVYIVKKNTGTAVLFYTFRGMPDGASGFVRIDSGKIQDFLADMFSEVYDKKDIGNNWYYISGE